jgi:hypothetical protein
LVSIGDGKELTLQQVLSVFLAILERMLDADLGQQRISLFLLVVHDGIENLTTKHFSLRKHELPEDLKKK